MQMPRRLDRALRLLRLPVLGLILYFTYRTGELVFRGYDPYYVMFSFNGHGVSWWSYLLVGGLLVCAWVFPMAWCRYLCPLGVALWPFSSVARLRMVRAAGACTGCGDCSRVCPQGIEVSRAEQVWSGECTLCLECTEACPSKGALDLQWRCFGR